MTTTGLESRTLPLLVGLHNPQAVPVSEKMEWKQERPAWCPHTDCQFLRRSQDALCGGKLPKPEPHDGDQNTHRLCIRTDDVFDLQVNTTDLGYFRWILDALDGKETSWLSRSARGADAE